MKRMPLILALLATTGAPVIADEITDTINSAILAYGDGDLRYTLEELAYVQQLVNEQRQEILDGFLAAAPEGWTKQDSNNYRNNGAGLTATSVFVSSNKQVSITIFLDSPQVTQMATIFSHSAALSAQGKLVRVGRYKFLEQDHQLSGVIEGRILVQGNGNDPEMLKSVIETIDLRGLGKLAI